VRPASSAHRLAMLVLGALCAAGTAARARAAETLGVLAVAEPPGPDERLAQLARDLRAALAEQGPGVLDEGAVRDRMLARPPSAALADLDRAYAGAIAAHAAGEYEPANRALRSVIEALEALPEAPEVFAAWTRAQLRLARSEQELGRGVTAQAVLERLLRAAPGLRADPRQFPPSFQVLVEEARARLAAQGTRRLTVESQPSCRVFVEGREVGSSPVALELPPGRYRVAGIAGGIRVPAQQVELDEDRSVQLDLSLAEALRPAAPGLAWPAAGRGAALLAAGSRLGLDRVVAGEALGQGAERLLAASVLDPRRGAVEREARVRLQGPGASPAALQALAAYLVAGQPSPLVSTPEGPSTAAPPLLAAHPSPLAPAPAAARPASPLGWVALGTGAASLLAAALTVKYARDAQGSYADARAMLGPAGRVAPPATVAGYNAAIRDGDGARNRAYAAGIAGATCVATTALLAYLSYRQTGQVGPFRF